VAPEFQNITKFYWKTDDFPVEMDCHSLLPGAGTKSLTAQ